MKQKTNLIVLGDSNTKGIINKNCKLQISKTNAVELIANHFKFSVTNISYYGQTLSKAYSKRFVDKILASKKPNMRNIVAISLGSNDADYNWIDVGLYPDQPHSSRTKLADFEVYYTSIIEFLQKNDFEIIMCSLLPFVPESYFDMVLTKLSDADSILKLLDGDKHNLVLHQDIFNEKIKEIAQKNNIKLLDLHEIVQNIPNWHRLYCLDGIHLTEKGQEIIANKIIESYKK